MHQNCSTYGDMALAIAAGQSVVSIALRTMPLVYDDAFRVVDKSQNHCALTVTALVIKFLDMAMWFCSIMNFGEKTIAQDSMQQQTVRVALQYAQVTISLINQGIHLSLWGLWRNQVAFIGKIFFLTIAHQKLFL